MIRIVLFLGSILGLEMLYMLLSSASAELDEGSTWGSPVFPSGVGVAAHLTQSGKFPTRKKWTWRFTVKGNHRTSDP